jgi:hypothetical protein
MFVALGAGERYWLLVRNVSPAHGLDSSRPRLAICIGNLSISIVSMYEISNNYYSRAR